MQMLILGACADIERLPMPLYLSLTRGIQFGVHSYAAEECLVSRPRRREKYD